MRDGKIGGNFKAFRESLGLSLTQCAKLLETSHGYLSEIESDKKQPSTNMLIKMRNELGLDLNRLIAQDATGVVKEKMFDYQHDRAKELLTTLKQIDKLSDEIKTTIKDGLKRAKTNLS